MKFFSKYIIAILFLFCFIDTVLGQEVSVRGSFTTDSIRVGDETMFHLSASYPSHFNVLFPDTTFDFSPFQCKGKTYFPTRTSAGKSYDSVVYYLTTFEVDSIQTLTLPVFHVVQQDCTAYTSQRDTVFLSQMVSKLPDSLTSPLPLRATIAYQDVSRQFNFQLFIIGLTGLLILAGIAWFLFGKSISRYFRLKRMRRAHKYFLDTYATQVENLKHGFSPATAESALSLWKKYMEQLDRKPYTKLTTRETISIEKDEMLGRHLRTIDGAIYGHSADIVAPLENLKSFADQRFSQKVQEVQHG